MATVNFGSKNEGTWFYFIDGDETAGVCLRVIGVEEHEKIEKMTVKHKTKFSHGVKYDDEQVNERMASKMRWNYCIVDWKGIQIDGVDVECNSENKARLVKITNFIKFAADCLEKLNEANDEIEEARLKNSETSSSGSLDLVE